MTHRRQNFMGGAAILAGAVAVTKLLGALYKIPLGNLLDREGMAHFYAAYNIYSLLLVLSTAGLPVALSRMVSRAAAQRRYGAVRRCLHLGLALLAALGLVCSAVMCLLPEALAAAPTVMGMPVRSSSRSTRLLAGGTSRASGSAARRGSSRAVTSRPRPAPAVTPPMAPAAHRSVPAPCRSRYRHSPSPMSSLPADSATCPAAVGTISPSPWE